MPDQRPPLPPFTAETAAQKVQVAEDAWNSRESSINDVPIEESERRIFGTRPAAEHGELLPLR